MPSTYTGGTLCEAEVVSVLISLLNYSPLPY